MRRKMRWAGLGGRLAGRDSDCAAHGKNNAIHRLHRTTRHGRNWPVLEHAIIGNIVPDFPLINNRST